MSDFDVEEIFRVFYSLNTKTTPQVFHFFFLLQAA